LEGFEPAAGWLDAPGPTSPGPTSVIVEEGAARFLVRVGGGHKTGLYLDQADNRLRVALLGAARAVLDVFASTAGFACSAGLAGCWRPCRAGRTRASARARRWCGTPRAAPARGCACWRR